MLLHPAPALQKNDKKARTLILLFSAIIFLAIMALSRVKLNVDLGFDVHVFAFANSVINSIVSILLIVALIAVKAKQYILHKKIMLVAMLLSVLFLVSYICHHLFAGEARFGDINHDGLVSDEEKAAVGNTRMLYYILLGTHIPLAGLILPFILFTAYRGLIAEWPQHKKLARITWPIWLYVAITGVIVYWMIKPYYI
jgi:putative membrane protein